MILALLCVVLSYASGKLAAAAYDGIEHDVLLWFSARRAAHSWLGRLADPQPRDNAAQPFPPATAPCMSVRSVAQPEPSRTGAIALAAIVVAAVWIALGLGIANAAPRNEPCGEERAAVKLGLDADAAAVNTRPVDTTVGELVALPRPRSIRADHRAAPVELTVYRIHATIVAYKLEADGDYHVVVDDGAGHHMIVEIPSSGCVGADRTAPATGAGKPRAVSAWRDQIVAARKALDDQLGRRRPAAKLRRVSIPGVVVTGVGFFDVLHGQVGVAPNGIELHPVIAIEIGGGS